MVSTVVVVGLRMATLTGRNWPVMASLPILLMFAMMIAPLWQRRKVRPNPRRLVRPKPSRAQPAHSGRISKLFSRGWAFQANQRKTLSTRYMLPFCSHYASMEHMTSPEPRLQTSDDRLSRIEGLLIKVSMRLDRMEQALSRLEMKKA
jgi:hypothetical protein